MQERLCVSQLKLKEGPKLRSSPAQGCAVLTDAGCALTKGLGAKSNTIHACREKRVEVACEYCNLVYSSTHRYRMEPILGEGRDGSHGLSVRSLGMSRADGVTL